MAEEFYSFEKALEKLKLREEELRRLVSEGEIRAYRSGETMKLRREDVEKLQKELTVPATGEVVDLEGGTEELIFSEEEPAEVVEEPGMETVQVSEEDTLVVEQPRKGRPSKAVEEEVELAEEIEEVAPVAAAPAARRARPAARPAAAAMVASGEVGDEGGLKWVLVLTTVILVVGAGALINAASIGKADPIGFFKSIGETFNF